MPYKDPEKEKAYKGAYNNAYYNAHKEERKIYLLAHQKEIIAYNKACRESHREEMKAYDKSYYLAHQEKKKAYGKDYGKTYYETHCEEIKVKTNAYKLAHREEVSFYAREYRLAYKEKVKTCKNAYMQTPAGKETNRRRKAKRRQFGFIILNDWFEGSEGHHIDKERVVYIPKELHKSIWHSVTKEINMGDINSVAFEYIEQNKS